MSIIIYTPSDTRNDTKKTECRSSNPPRDFGPASIGRPNLREQPKKIKVPDFQAVPALNANNRKKCNDLAMCNDITTINNSFTF